MPSSEDADVFNCELAGVAASVDTVWTETKGVRTAAVNEESCPHSEPGPRMLPDLLPVRTLSPRAGFKLLSGLTLAPEVSEDALFLKPPTPLLLLDSGIQAIPEYGNDTDTPVN